MRLLDATLDHIESVPADAEAPVRERLDALTKPPGSLGRLEDLAAWYVAATGKERPRVLHKTVCTMAGDHGVAARGVSAFPQEVTAAMMTNFLRGGAAVNVLAAHAGARVIVVDCGVAAELPPHSRLRNEKIAPGTADMTEGPAMTREEAVASVEIGVRVVEDELRNGLDLLATGEMGIGNTTPATAMLAAFTGEAVSDITGRGTGVDDEGLARKIAVIEKALAVNAPDADDPLDVLAKVGGFEIGAVAGLCLAGARHRVPVVVDGFISTAGALLAARMKPECASWMLSAHASVERGHMRMLRELGLEPLFDLRLRLGEGTGAVLAMQMVEAGVRILTEMATFADMGVGS